MRKDTIKQSKADNEPCSWKIANKKSLINKLPVFNTVDDEEYFFEVEDF